MRRRMSRMTAGGSAAPNTLEPAINIVALDLAAGFVGLGAGVVVVTDNSSTQSTLGTVQLFPDSTVFTAITVLNCSITDFDPGPFDGSNPDVTITISGSFPVNSTMWGSLTGVVTTLV